jgi:hypothetical protein
MPIDDLTEPLLRCEFKRDSLNLSDRPLQFIAHELAAIVERMPAEHALAVNTAQKITVLIYVEH